MSEADNIVRPWLSDAEVVELTKRQRAHAQLRQLKALGFARAVHYRTDGSFVVLRSLIENSKTKSTELTLDRLKHAS